MRVWAFTPVCMPPTAFDSEHCLFLQVVELGQEVQTLRQQRDEVSALDLQTKSYSSTGLLVPVLIICCSLAPHSVCAT